MSGSPLYRARQIGSRTTLVTATVALIAALSGAFQLAPAGEVAGATTTNRFEASTPCRLVDTRSGFGFQAPSIDRIRVQVTGRCNVPREAVAASFTVTVSQPTGAGYLTMWPATTSIPEVSTLNFEQGDDRANGAIVRLAGDGAVDITASAPTQILLDVTGWFVPVAASTSGRFVPVEPDRIFDSRAYGFSRPLNAGEIVTIALPGGTPKDAAAVAVNLTSVAPSPPGYLTAFPAGTEPPEASAVNTNAANQTRAASTLVAVSPQGLSIFSKAGGHVIVDLTGWFTGPSAPETGAGLFVANDAPLRVRDTRSADPVWDGGAVDIGLPVGGASAIAANVTLVGSHDPGFLTAFAGRTTQPETSTVNVDRKGATAANLALLPISTTGLTVASEGGADVLIDLTGWFVGEPVSAFADQPANKRPPICTSYWDANSLTNFMASGDPYVGADYQRSFALPDGRVLWFFQDVLIRTRTGMRFTHNAALVQTGNCFEALHTGNFAQPRDYLLPWATQRYSHWFWPLAGGMGTDGNFHLFVAEMRENGPGYLTRTEPTATYAVTIRLSDMAVIDERLAPNSSPSLYGFSVTSDASYSYLYSQCHRQFGYDQFPFSDPPVYVHDFACSADVTVARVPKGNFASNPSYWNGFAWTNNPTTAVPVIPRLDRAVNPTQVTYDNGRFIAVTKEGDWWGDTIYLDVATRAQGPWTTYATIPVAPRCGDCNTYFASIVPYRTRQDQLIVGLSNNRFTGFTVGLYSPTFLNLPAP